MPYRLEWSEEKGIIRKIYCETVTSDDWASSWCDMLELGDGIALKSARVLINDYSNATISASSDEASDPVEKAYELKAINSAIRVIAITDNPLVYGFCRMIQQLSEDILDFTIVRSQEEAEELIEAIF